MIPRTPKQRGDMKRCSNPSCATLLAKIAIDDKQRVDMLCSEIFNHTFAILIQVEQSLTVQPFEIDKLRLIVRIMLPLYSMQIFLFSTA